MAPVIKKRSRKIKIRPWCGVRIAETPVATPATPVTVHSALIQKADNNFDLPAEYFALLTALENIPERPPTPGKFIPELNPPLKRPPTPENLVNGLNQLRISLPVRIPLEVAAPVLGLSISPPPKKSAPPAEPAEQTPVFLDMPSLEDLMSITLDPFNEPAPEPTRKRRRHRKRQRVRVFTADGKFIRVNRTTLNTMRKGRKDENEG